MATRVVIIGGGFVGLSAARQLAGDNQFEVTLISASANFEYHAALYRSATGRSPLEVAVPLIEIFEGINNVQVVQDKITSVDTKHRQVISEGGVAYPYDELIVGTGSVAAYFGIPGLAEHAYNMHTINDAVRLHHHLREEMVSGAKPDLNYVVVGAGPSGVELVGELTHYIAKLRREYSVEVPYTISLVEAAPRILPTLPEAVARVIDQRLRSLGVAIYTSTAVKGEDAKRLTLPNGDITTHTVIWTAGMANNPFCIANPGVFKLNKRGRVEVNEQLQAHAHVWVGGDGAATEYGGMGQTAAYDGRYIARNLQLAARGQQPLAYRPSQPVAAIPVGPNWAAISSPGRQVYGYRGWIMRRWLDLQLYRQVMPLRLAIRAWRKGTHAQSDR